MEQSKLEVSIKQFGIDTYFEAISGLGHDFATSKADNGKALMRNFGISAANTCLIGDTLHDLEVGQELGCTVVLVANGHQSFLRLVGNHSYVVSDLFELMAFFNNCQ
jgi:phosphoglycolate phosphatase-like HAD superfamily hydrolase